MDTPRTDPPYAASEREQLVAYLDYHRETLRLKTAGLTTAQLQQTLAPSEMTLGGMMKHCALNEVSWFAARFAGGVEGEPWDSVDWQADYDWDWHSAVDDSPEQIVALWESGVAQARDAIEGADLEALAQKPVRSGDHPNLRWILLHMIEEYARHNGHADLIRESIDGATGE
ncbi:MAG: hypothetical protein JWO46_2538 [Nocardioidaceae bacterium]|nr:hypothetical protein [Nocardioidaceae bacterium]